MVSVDVKHHVYLLTYLPSPRPDKHGFRLWTLSTMFTFSPTKVTEFRSCVKVDVAVLGSSSSSVTEPYGFCGRKATLNHAHSLPVTVCPSYVNPTSQDIKLHVITTEFM